MFSSLRGDNFTDGNLDQSLLTIIGSERYGAKYNYSNLEYNFPYSVVRPESSHKGGRTFWEKLGVSLQIREEGLNVPAAGARPVPTSRVI